MKKAFLISLLLFLVCSDYGQSLAPGGPGADAQWASAGKQGVGTSASLTSKVWFTLQGGALTEVYYPDVTKGNVHLLQFVVVDPKKRKVETEREDANHEIKVLRPDSLTFQQINRAKSGIWKITKTYVTDPDKLGVVMIDVKFETKNKNLNLYYYYDPSIANSGMGDSAEGSRVFEGNIHSSLLVTSKVKELTNGFYKTSDGLKQLRKFGKIKNAYSKADPGNVVQMGRITEPESFTVILSFADNQDGSTALAKMSKEKGFWKVRTEYEKEWSDYVKTLPGVDPKYQAQFNMAAMQLKAHEDKTNPGANIASLSVPWGGGDNANEDNVGGYHLVWSRDLYQVFTAYLAIGDRAAAERALDFLLKVQQKPDGSFPQNSWLDGRPFWGSLQMDEVAYPLIMAYQLGKDDRETYEKHLKKAADFIVRNGPATPQERWEEEAGYSPSTIAAEIAGLVCAAEIARKNGDLESAEKYLKTADEWEANIEKWTVTTTGKYGDGNYYLRITQNGKPDAGDKIELNNGAGTFDEREIVDAGFLELVRLGIRSPDDPLIKKSVKVIDEVIKVDTPNGEGFYRYNNDGYGEMDDGRRWNWDGKYTGKGRLWAFLSGERGQYELARCEREKERASEGEKKTLDSGLRTPDCLSKAQSRLDAMLAFANEGLMIPEQVWDKKEVPEADSQFSPNLKFGEGTGSATPLAWSMAQFIRLAVNIKEGRNPDTPDVVYRRYVVGKKDDLKVNTPIKSILKNCDFNSRVRQADFQIKGKFIIQKQTPDFWPCKNGKTLAVLFYTGEGKNVEFIGDFTDWKPKSLKFEEFDKKTGSKRFSKEFPTAGRIEYKLIVDGNWIIDPRNPKKIDNGVGGENSVLELPGYQPSKWAKDIPKSPLDPKVSEFEIDSKRYGKRKIKTYIPSEYFNRGIAPKLKVLYLQDGSEYITRAKAINVLENLVAAKKVEPFMLVFIDPKDRMKEYWANTEWADFVAEEVVPAVEKKYFTTIKTGRENRALLGASLGGITSVWIGLKHPGKFANIGGQSSSFWVDNERVVKELAKLKGDEKFNFYFDDGIFEGVEDSRKVTKLLRGKGFPVTYREAYTGHNWTSWKDRLADAFVALMK
jgi:glucoamylase